MAGNNTLNDLAQSMAGAITARVLEARAIVVPTGAGRPLKYNITLSDRRESPEPAAAPAGHLGAAGEDTCSPVFILIGKRYQRSDTVDQWWPKRTGACAPHSPKAGKTSRRYKYLHF